MDPAQIDSRIVAVLARSTRLDPERLRPEATLEELDVTSLDVVNVLFELEEEFGIELPAEAEEGFRSVGDVVARVRAVVLAQPPG